jgi:UDP-glucose 4-epimerase
MKLEMNNKKILITGGAGFIGSNLAKRILKQYPGAKITVIDNLFTGDISNLHPLKVADITFREMDTVEIDEHLNSLPAFDIVYHFGEYSRIVKSFDDIEYVFETNLYGTTKVLEACRKWGAKLIYSASSSKFGNNGQDENLSPYAWAKSKIVELIKNYREWYGLEYEICYFFNVYGPNQICSGDYATVIGIFENQMKNGTPLTVVSPGTQTRDFTHVEDIVDGVILASEKGLNREWHLRSGKSHSIIEVANMFNTEWQMIPERRGERLGAEDIKTDTEEVLGWQPKWNLSDYINLKIEKHADKI